MGNWDVSKPDKDGERELLDRAVKALETEFATKTCNKTIASKLVASEDCISRQAAIDAINRLSIHDFAYEVKTGWIVRDDAVDELRRLPPVTPQYTEAEIQKMQELEQAEIQKAYELGKTETQPCGDCISRQAAIEEIRFGQSFITKIHPTGEIEHLFDKENKALEAAVERIEALPSVTPKQEPCKDVVSLGVFEQVMWERDVAIDQLKQLGYGFGEKPKTGHWIETAEEYYKAVNEYGGGVNEDTPYFVDDIACSECLSMFSVIDNETERFDCCPHCGTKMVDPQDSCDTCKHKQESEEISREEIAAILARESEDK